MFRNRLLVSSIVAIAVLTSLSAFAAEPAEPGRDWPLFRGDPRSTGVAQTSLADQLAVLWKYPVPKGSFEGTPAIVDGVVYLGDLDGTVFALELATGKLKWTFKTDSGFMASPAV